MLCVTILERGGNERKLTFDKDEVSIGRIQGNDIILPKGNISKRHARVVVKDAKFIVVDLKSTNGTYVNKERISAPRVIGDRDKVYIGDFILRMNREDAAAVPAGAVAAMQVDKDEVDRYFAPDGPPASPGPTEAAAPAAAAPPVPPIPGASAGEDEATRAVDAAMIEAVMAGDRPPIACGAPAPPIEEPEIPTSALQVPLGVARSSGAPAGRPPAGMGVADPWAEAAAVIGSEDGLAPSAEEPGEDEFEVAVDLDADSDGEDTGDPGNAFDALNDFPPIDLAAAGEAPSGQPGDELEMAMELDLSDDDDDEPVDTLGATVAIDESELEAELEPAAEPAAQASDAAMEPPAETVVPPPVSVPEPELDLELEPELEPELQPELQEPEAQGLIDAIPEASAPLEAGPEAAAQGSEPGPEPAGYVGALDLLYERVAGTVFADLDPDAIELSDERWQELEAGVGSVVRAAAEAGDLGESPDVGALTQDLLYEFTGLGPVEYFLADDLVTEIVVNGPHTLLARRNGPTEQVPHSFSGPRALDRVVARLAATAGFEPDERLPLMGGVLPDGTCYKVLLPPLVTGAPVIRFLKASRRMVSGDVLIQAGALDADVLAWLEGAVADRRNIAVCGRDRLTRVSVMSALAATIPAADHVLVAESVPHTLPAAAGAVRVRVPPASEEREVFFIRLGDLLADRLLIDELSGEDAVAVLHHALGGAEGILAGLYARSAEDLIHRLVVQGQVAGLTAEASAALTGSGLDVVVAVGPGPRVESVCEVHPGPTLVPIFSWEPDEGGAGAFVRSE